MIVKHHEQGWEIISHYAHGLISGKIAQQLKVKLRPDLWIDVLTGIIEHDDHLPNFDEQDYLTKNGTPKDFTMEGGSDKNALEHADCIYSNAMQKSQLVALMVGRHLAFIYGGLASTYKPMKEFLADIDKLRRVQRKLYGLKKADENELYDIMLFCDRLSLILCQDETPEVGRELEINQTIKDKKYFISKDRDANFYIEPWPFKNIEFKLKYEYRILDSATFKDNTELKRALGKAKIRIRSCTFQK